MVCVVSRLRSRAVFDQGMHMKLRCAVTRCAATVSMSLSLHPFLTKVSLRVCAVP